MANNPQKPGGPNGIVDVLEQRFHVSPTPTIKREEVTRRIQEVIAARKITCEQLTVSDQPVTRGTLMDASGLPVAFPEGSAFDRCYVALINPDCAMRWAHPAYWAFVPADGDGNVTIQDTELPEHTSGIARLIPVT